LVSKICPDSRSDNNSTLADVHLPSRKNCSLLFLQQMAEGSKKTIERSKVPSNSVPQWPELSVKLLSALVMADPVLKDYFPDKYRSGKLPERDFFWGVVFAIKPAFGKAIVKEAMELRNKPKEGEAEDETKHMVIKDSILRQMLAAPMFTCKLSEPLSEPF
jgi:hypothetical protein